VHLLDADMDFIARSTQELDPLRHFSKPDGVEAGLAPTRTI
jgi:hypothetical protein